jgi:uncharacterized repeat protein (TIGR01451 family)
MLSSRRALLLALTSAVVSLGALASAGPAAALVLEEHHSANLDLSLAANAPLLFGGHIHYTLTVKNEGPNEADSATVDTQLPDEVTSIASETCTFSSATHIARCPFASIADGASAEEDFSAYVQIITIGIPLEAFATITASEPEDPNPEKSAKASCYVVTSLIVDC